MRFFSLAIIAVSTCFAQAQYEVIEEQSTLQILSPSLQKRETAKIRLPNGLEAYIISDPDVDKCAASLSVSAGSFHDPKGSAGMAHFCEHMVFMASEKYPDENLMWQHTAAYQGMLNAYTKPYCTVYTFSTNPTGFFDGLDIFAQFFISPLFKEGAIARELKAVDQEHQKNIENDGWRIYSIFKETASQDHPISLFSTGTKETLRSIPRQKLIDWYHTHYSSERMHLVVYGNQSLEELISQVTASFSPVPCAQQEIPQNFGKMLSREQLGHLVTIDPVQDLKKVCLTWELPLKFCATSSDHTPEFIAYLLSNKEENSLFEQLKSEGLAEDLHAEIDLFGKQASLFQLEIELTEKGVKEIDQVLDRTFQTLRYLKMNPIPSYVFDEYKQMSQLLYQYQSRTLTYRTVETMADDLTIEPLSAYPQSTLPKDFDQKKAEQLLQFLTPHNCAYILIAPSNISKTTSNRTEKWHGGQYSIAPIKYERLNRLLSNPLHHNISCPKPNSYIPKNIQSNLSSSETEVYEPSLQDTDPS